MLGDPNAIQPAPVSYCQIPLLLSTAVTAIDSTATPSASVMEPSATIDATLSAEGLLSSSATAVRVGVRSAKTGASFTGVILIEALSVAVLKVEVLPLTVVSATLPAEPVVVSQARKVMLTNATESALGI